MTRYAHFVGSLPRELTSDDDTTVLRWFVENTRGWPLTGVPRDLDSDWIMDYLRGRAAHADVFEVISPGDYADYNDFPSLGVRAGRTLEPKHVAMDRVERIGRIAAAFDALQRERPELAGVKLQISQPNPLDLAMFVFSGAAVSAGLPLGRALRHCGVVVAALRHLPVFTEAVLTEMAEVIDAYGDRIVWQVESPIALLGAVKAQRLRSQWALTPLLAAQLASFLGRAHEIGAAITVHLCYGDYGHKALLNPTSLGPAVRLLNGVSRRLRRAGTPLPPAHVPCGFGAEPAPAESDYYAPLRRLDPDWPVIAGVVSPDDVAGSARALALFEQAAGRTAYGVATACGLGRLSPDGARAAAAATVATAGV
jgi:hypothetical protein